MVLIWVCIIGLLLGGFIGFVFGYVWQDTKEDYTFSAGEEIHIDNIKIVIPPEPPTQESKS